MSLKKGPVGIFIKAYQHTLLWYEKKNILWVNLAPLCHLWGQVPPTVYQLNCLDSPQPNNVLRYWIGMNILIEIGKIVLQDTR